MEKRYRNKIINIIIIIFQTIGKNWKVRRNTWYVKLEFICKEMI